MLAFLQGQHFSFDHARDPMLGQINCGRTYGKDLRDFTDRPSAERVKVENLKMLRFDAGFDPFDCALEQPLFPLQFPLSVAVVGIAVQTRDFLGQHGDLSVAPRVLFLN